MSNSDHISNRARRTPSSGRRPRKGAGSGSDRDLEGFLDEAGEELRKRNPASSGTARGGRSGTVSAPARKSSRKLARSVKDDVSLALLEAGIVSPAQVARAQDAAGGRALAALWRFLLVEDGVDRAEVLEVAAATTGHPRVTVLDEQATLNLFDALRESHSAYWVDAVAARGALPVDSVLDAATGELKVTFATADPFDPEIGALIGKLGVLPELLYAPASVMDPLVETLVGSRPDPSAPPVDHAVESVPDDSCEDDREEAEDPEPEDETITVHPGAERDRVVVSLLRKGIVTSDQVARVLAREGETGRAGNGLWRSLAEMNGVDRDRVFAEAAAVHVFRSEEITRGRPDLDFCRLILETMTAEQRRRMMELNLIPFDYELNDKTNEPTLIFVSHDPGQPEVHHLLGRLNSGRFEARYAPESSVRKILKRLAPASGEASVPPPTQVRTFDMRPPIDEPPPPADSGPTQARRRDLDALFEKLLVDAVRVGASDIHMYPGPERQTEIHFRVDGRLRPWKTDDDLPAARFMAAVRVLVGIRQDADAPGPLEGHIQRRIEDAPVRFRVSALPMTTGNGAPRAESIVIRIQDSRNLPRDVAGLGLGEDTRKKIERALGKSQGMVVLTGPAGSGRTTTMAAALHSVIHPEVSTISIEDPVDYVRDGVRHVHVDRRLELEAALRTVLRHDPDVVLVGEIRDRVSADLAVKLASTGHLVFSLLQTQDAVSAVSLLLRLGVEPFLVAYAVNLIVAQRLVREVCPECRVSDDRRDPVLMRRLGFSDEEILSEAIQRSNPGTKCGHCSGRGYRGRRVVSEALYFSTPIRHLITESGSGIDETALREAAGLDGMTTLAQSCRTLVLQGVTTVDEVMRLLHS